MGMKIAGFLTFYLAVYGGAHAWFFSRLSKAFPLSRMGIAGVTAFFAVMVAAPILVFLMERYHYEGLGRITAWIGYSWQGFFLFAASAYLLFAGLRGLTVLAAKALAGTPPAWIQLPRTAMTAALILASAATVIGWLSARTPHIRTVTVHTAKAVGSGKPLRIALISDVHIGVVIHRPFVEKLSAQLEAVGADAVLCAGDLLDSQLDHCEALAAPLAEIQPRLGKYAVLGNHEYFPGIRKSLAFLEKAGFTVLRGAAKEAGDGLVIAGVDDETGKAFNVYQAVDEAQLLAALPQDRFVLFIKHRPVVPKDSRGLFDLMVSGHTHGGQIFPFHFFTRLAFPYHAGRYDMAPGQSVYVSRGTGTWGPPMRLGAPPEITVFEIIPGQGGQGSP